MSIEQSKFLHRGSGQYTVTTILGIFIFVKPELEFLPCVWSLKYFSFALINVLPDIFYDKYLLIFLIVTKFYRPQKA